MRGRAVGGGSAGVATLGILLVLVTLTLLAHGAVVRARYEYMAARASVTLAQEPLALRSALDRAAAGGVGGGMPSVVGTLGDVSFAASGEWVGPEHLLLTGTAVSGSRPGGNSAARIVWFLDPVSRISGLGASVTHGAGVSGALDPGGAPVPPDHTLWPSPAYCAAADTELGVLRVGASLPEIAPFDPIRHDLDPAGAPEATGVPPLGLLSGSEILSRLDAVISTTTTFHGVDGAPELLFRGTEGSLTVTGGEGRGVLAVGGDLVVAEGARFEGLALVGGDLEVRPGGTLVGVTAVRGSILVRTAGHLQPRACAGVAVLERAVALRAAFRPSWGAWMLPGG